MLGTSTHSSAVLIVLFLMAGHSRAAENWPAFRGPTGDGQAMAKDLPVRWSETDNVRWKTAIHDKGWSSPVIWGDQIWLTTAREDGKELFAICVDRKTGAIRHDIKVFDVEKPAFCHPFNSYASSTPVIEEGRVYVHYGSNGTACFDTATGKKLWERRDFPCDHFRGAGSSPILHGRLLILIFDGVDVQYVVALDKQTGQTVWKKDRAIAFLDVKDADHHKGYATPAILDLAGKAQLVCPAPESIMAYDPATGEELWRVRHEGMNSACRPVLRHGLIYVTVGYKPELLAIQPGGRGDITKDIKWRANRGVPQRPSVVLDGDLLFMVSDAGIASCLEAKTGKPVWQERLGGDYSSSLLLADGHIYAADQKGTVHVIEPARQFKVLAANRLPDGCMASPAAIGKSLFLRTKTHLYCLEKR